MGRFVYINGEMFPEAEARISIRDLGFVYGDGVFDTARTFGGRIFRLGAHIDRLYDSLAYVRIEPGLTKAEMTTATEALVTANLPALREEEDYWVTHRITAGQLALDGEPAPDPRSTIIIDCVPLPLRARAAFFRDGIPVVIATRRKIEPEALSPRVKTSNYLNMMLAQREVAALAPDAWALLCGPGGYVAEGAFLPSVLSNWNAL